jgi:hypothetical protein
MEVNTRLAPQVAVVSRSGSHTFSKPVALSIRLIAGRGVEGDAHAGSTVKHRSRVARDPTAPNLRQVHLMHSELFDELAGKGFAVAPGEMGENITTRGIALLDLPAGTRLHLGASAIIEITGLRNPCAQLNGLHPGLMQAVLDQSDNGKLIRKAGVMSIVIVGGDVYPSDPIAIELPAEPYRALEPV